MNKLIEQLARQVDACYIPRYDMWQMDSESLEKFAELIAAECINMIEAEAKTADEDSVHGMRNAAGLIGRSFNI